MINDDVNARGEIKDVVRAAKYRQERKNVQDSLLFATGKRQLRRACGDISILRTTENGSQPIEEPESYNDMYGGFAGRSATATEEEKIKRRFLRSRDRWMTLMDCGHKSTKQDRSNIFIKCIRIKTCVSERHAGNGASIQARYHVLCMLP